MVNARRWLAGPGWLILPLLLSIYLITFQGTFQADDEHIFAARAQSMALRSDLEAPQVYGNARVRQLELWGDQATEVEPALSLIGAALYWLALKLNWGGVQLMFVINLYVVALTALLVFQTCRLLLMEDRFALVTALGFGLSTFAMPYALTLYRDPLAMLMAALAFYGLALLLSAGQDRRNQGFLWIGAGIALGVLAKNITLAVIPTLIVSWLLYAKRKGRQLFSPTAIRISAGLLLLLILSLLIPSTGPLARFNAGYYLGLASHFWTKLEITSLIAALGPWISPAKSIFLFAPMLLLAWVRHSERDNLWVFQAAGFSFAFFISLAQALFYGADWYGGYGWGLRFMLPALPPLAVVAGFTIQRWWRAAGLKRLAVPMLLIMGFFIQQSASWVHWRWAYQRMQTAGLDPLSPVSVWSPQAFAPAWQLSGLASWPAYSTAWLRLLWQEKPGALLVPIACLILLLVSLLIHTIGSSMHWRRQLEWPKRAVLVAGLVGPILAIGLLGGDPALADDKDHFHVGISELTAQLAEGEVVVMDAYGTSLWHFMMNRWSSPVPWYSLPYEVPSASDVAEAGSQPAAASLELFGRLFVEHDRLYYLTTSDVPDFMLSREVDWLGANSSQLELRRLDGEPTLYIYSFQID